MLPPRHQRSAKKALWIYWPRRIVGERGALILCLLLALGLLVTAQLAPQATARARMAVFDRFGIVLGAVAVPAQQVSQAAEHVMGLSDMAADLARLREENARLKQWYDRARELEAENRSLRGLVNLADVPRARYVSGRVIATSGSAFSQSLIVDAGARQGVAADMVALSGEGLVGRVIANAERSAQVMLLTDVNARIPVVIENSRHRGVLAGDNSGFPTLLYLPDDAAVSVGERVLTSGLGGVFAPGLPVGVVVAVTPQGIRVRPFADLRRLEVIQLADFARPAVVPPQLPADNARPMPVPPPMKKEH